jgi:hypothetical protein
MRTKTLLITAALCAAGAATSMAQVYSVNMVGYINQQIPQGWSIIANHLNNTPDNRMTTLLPSPAPGTRLAQFNAATGNFRSAVFFDAETGWEGDTSIVLDPGKASYYFAPAALTHTFVGEVATGTSTITLTPGWQMASSTLPQTLPLDAAPPAGLGFPIANGDRIYLFRGTGFQADFYNENQWDDGTAPVPAIGEGFYVFNGGTTSKDWTRTFAVGQ